MKYLITGGCGFLGSNIADELIRRGDSVLLFDNLTRLGSEENLRWLKSRGDFIFMQGDVRLAGDCNAALSNFQPDVIFHLAGQVAMTTSLRDPRADFEVNAFGTLNILEAVRILCPAAGLIYSSTNKVYGDLEGLRYDETDTRYSLIDFPLGINEEIGLSFQSPYGCSKGSADQYVLDYSRMYGLKTAVFRHSSMYGGRQFYSIDQGWIGWFAAKALEQYERRDSEFTVSGSGKQVRDLLHADDMVQLYIKAAEQIKNITGQAFNIGGGVENSLSILELLSILEDIFQMELRVKKIQKRESDQRVFIADIRKVQAALDWRPSVGKIEGLKKMITWIREARAIVR